MPQFDEDIFVYSLTVRPEDAKRFAHIFKHQWLEKSEYQPVLQEIYSFTKKFGEPPSLITLHKLFEKKDNNFYNLRVKETLETLQSISPDRSNQLRVLEEAKNVAVIRSLEALTSSSAFQKKIADLDGPEVLREMQSWMIKFSTAGEDRTMNLKQAVENLFQTAGYDNADQRIPTHIKPLDDWTGGGLRRKQLAVIIAPTGHGKSAILLNIGHKIASIEEKRVWVITNELSIEEMTERELAMMSGIEVEKIMADPTIAYEKLEYHWKKNLDKKLIITEYNREISTDDIESDLAKMVTLSSEKPDVIILDYIERMKPSGSGYQRDKEWGWLGAVAKDLVRIAKRHNILIWTAAQTNRGGMSAKDIDLSHAQSSIRHLQESTAVISMCQEDIPGTNKVMIKLAPLKMRQSKRSSRAAKLECDLSRMYIEKEGIEVEKNEEEDDEEDTGYTPRASQKRKYRNRI